MEKAQKAPTRSEKRAAFNAALEASDFPKAIKKQVKRLGRVQARMERIMTLAGRDGADGDALKEEMESREAEAKFIALKLKRSITDYPDLAKFIKIK